MSDPSPSALGGRRPVPPALAALRQFDTPTICNAIELFGVRPQTIGYLDGSVRACSPQLPPMVGYAATATFRAGKASDGPPLYQQLREQVQAFAALPGPAVVVFQDLDDPPCAATFGEVMCTTYQAFGASGLITSGAGRDLEQVEALGFPTFTGSTICSHGYPRIVELNVPVDVGGVTIEPGDLLHGDRNGVTTVPEGLVEELPAACRRMIDAESIVLDYLREAAEPDAAELGRRFQRASEAAKTQALGR